MASLGAAFLPQEEQKLALNRNLGDALAVIARRLFGKDHAVSKMEREWGYSRSTAKNALKGLAGGVPVTVAVRAQQTKHQNGWALWDALGELIIGEPRDAYEERVLQQAIEVAEHAQANLTRLRAHRAALLSGPDQLDRAGGGQGPGSLGGETRSPEHQADPTIRHAPEGARDRRAG